MDGRGRRWLKMLFRIGTAAKLAKDDILQGQVKKVASNRSSRYPL